MFKVEFVGLAIALAKLVMALQRNTVKPVKKTFTFFKTLA